MRAALRRLLLRALRSDALACFDGAAWSTRCLHCRAHLQLRGDGEALGVASLEHVVPRAWFGMRAAAALTTRVGDDPDDARNLAIACARCNHAKGTRHDARGPGDTRARDVVAALLDARMQRWQDAPDPSHDAGRT